MSYGRKCDSPLKYGVFRYILLLPTAQNWNIIVVLSPFWNVALYSRTSLHCVLESSELMGMIASRGTEMCFRACSVFRYTLLTYSRSHIVSLVLIKLLKPSIRTTSLWQSPAGHVLLWGWVCWCFWDVTTWSNRSWRRGVIFEATISASESKCV